MLAIVIASISANLALLAFFKYYNFTEENLNRVALALGGLQWLPVLQVVLPVGISFYTFKSMSYCIDVYPRRRAADEQFHRLQLLRALFPDLVPARSSLRRSSSRCATGPTRQQVRPRHCPVRHGLAKKILIANPLGFCADASFGAAARHTLEAWVDCWRTRSKSTSTSRVTATWRSAWV